MKEQTAKAVFWIVWFSRVQVLSFLVIILVACWLSPNDYGVMALVGFASLCS